MHWFTSYFECKCNWKKYKQQLDEVHFSCKTIISDFFCTEYNNTEISNSFLKLKLWCFKPLFHLISFFILIDIFSFKLTGNEWCKANRWDKWKIVRQSILQWFLYFAPFEMLHINTSESNQYYEIWLYGTILQVITVYPMHINCNYNSNNFILINQMFHVFVSMIPNVILKCKQSFRNLKNKFKKTADKTVQ